MYPAVQYPRLAANSFEFLSRSPLPRRCHHTRLLVYSRLSSWCSRSQSHRICSVPLSLRGKLCHRSNLRHSSSRKQPQRHCRYLPLYSVVDTVQHQSRDHTDVSSTNAFSRKTDHLLIMAKIANWLSTWHAFLTALPQNGYHNISRVVQPQMRSLCESFQATSLRSKSDIEMRPLKPRGRNNGFKHAHRPAAAPR